MGKKHVPKHQADFYEKIMGKSWDHRKIIELGM